METKTKLGLSFTMMAAITCFLAVYGGYPALLLAVGYILICEKDSWLRTIAVSALLLNLVMTLVIAVIGLIPNGFSSLAQTLYKLFEKWVDFSGIINFFKGIMDFLNGLRKLALLALGVISLFGVKIKLGWLEKFVGKFLSHPGNN